MQTKQLAQLIQDTLEDNKAKDITPINVQELTDIMDEIIICTATSKRHGNALADKLLAKLTAEKLKPLGIEGLEESEWILIDCYDVVVHIMLADIREFYALEKLWASTETKQSQKHESAQ